MILMKRSDRIGLDPLFERQLQVFEARNVPDEIGDHVDSREVVPAPKDGLKVRDTDYISVEVGTPHSVELVDQKVMFRLTELVEWHL